MLRKKSKWNHMKCSVKAEKEQKTKIKTKKAINKKKTVTNMIYINPTKSKTNLNINDLNEDVKRQKL